MKIGLFFLAGIALALGYLSLIAHSWADGQPADANRAPAQQQAAVQ